MRGMTFSMPIRATWTGGAEVDRPGVALVLDDDDRAGVGHGEVARPRCPCRPGGTPRGGVAGRCRSARWCSAVNGSPSFSANSWPHVGGRQVQGGRDDVHRAAGRPVARGTRPGRSRRRGCPPSARRVVQLHLLADHRLRLDHALDVVLAGDVEHEAVGLGGVLGPEHRGAAGGDVPLELDQQLVEVGDRRSVLIAWAASRHVLPVRDLATALAGCAWPSVRPTRPATSTRPARRAPASWP